MNDNIMEFTVDQPLTIVCAADDKYAMPLTVTMRSVIENLKSDRQVILFVIDGGITKANKQKIISSLTIEQVKLEIHWVKPHAELLANMKISGHVTVATYFRLLIPDLLPNQFNKAIYLDGDLVVTEDLGKLWNIELGDNHVLAAQDISVPYVSSPAGLANYQELGIPADYKYFNAGVLLINLEKWRSDNVSTKAIEYLEQNQEHIRWWDQDGLNAVLAGKWGQLDSKWNFMLLPELYNSSLWQDSNLLLQNSSNGSKNFYILHFASASKPWKYSCKSPAKSLFFDYLDRTKWSGWRPQESFMYKMYRSWLWKLGKEMKQQLLSFKHSV